MGNKRHMIRLHERNFTNDIMIELLPKMAENYISDYIAIL